MHIPPERMLAQDQVDMFDLGPPDTVQSPQKLRMHAVDAKHAMAVEPARYMLDLPEAMPPQLPDADAEPEHTGAAGEAWHTGAKGALWYPPIEQEDPEKLS